MTTYKIEIDGQRAVDLVAALKRAGLYDLADDIDRQIKNQRAQAVRALWMQGGRRRPTKTQKAKGSTNFSSLFSGVEYERQSAI
jgi:hypothetical protein